MTLYSVETKNGVRENVTKLEPGQNTLFLERTSVTVFVNEDDSLTIELDTFSGNAENIIIPGLGPEAFRSLCREGITRKLEQHPSWGEYALSLIDPKLKSDRVLAVERHEVAPFVVRTK